MPNDFGKTLKKYRNDAKITVKQISEILTEKGYKASESTIYSWENNNSQPTPGAFLAMCETYGIVDALKAFGYNGYNEDGSLRLNIKEIDLIEKYRVLDAHGTDMVDTVLDKEYDRCMGLQNEAGPVLLNAAHERTDIEVTDEMREHGYYSRPLE